VQYRTACEINGSDILGRRIAGNQDCWQILADQMPNAAYDFYAV
jgi:hypothetical protein